MTEAHPIGPNTTLIPPLASAWERLDFVELLSLPTAFASVSQVNSVYSPEGAHHGERQWTRGSLEATVKVAHAARELGAKFFWITYDIFRSNYPKNQMDASQYAHWEEQFRDWDAKRRAWDGELAEQLQELVQPGDLQFTELALQSSFVGTPWELHLSRLGIRTIIFCGLHLDWCIEGNVRHARDLGYMPIVVGDATACGRREDEPEALNRINNFFAPVLPAEKVVALMAEAQARKGPSTNDPGS